MSNSFISPIATTKSGATTPTRIDLGAMAMKGYSIYPRAPLTGASLSDCLVSYQDTHWRWSNASAEMQSVYSTPQPT